MGEPLSTMQLSPSVTEELRGFADALGVPRPLANQVIVIGNGKPFGALFLDDLGVGLCMVDLLIDPGLGSKEKHRVCVTLLRLAKTKATLLGKYLFAVVRRPSLLKMLESRGFMRHGVLLGCLPEPITFKPPAIALRLPPTKKTGRKKRK